MVSQNPNIQRKKRRGEIGFRFALNGLWWLIKTQINARIHVFVTLLVIVLGVIFHLSVWEWMIITLCIGGVFATELINTALENLTDLVSPEWNEKAGRIKDLSAGAVFTMAIVAVICGVVIFVPKIFPVICNVFGYC